MLHLLCSSVFSGVWISVSKPVVARSFTYRNLVVEFIVLG